MKCKQMQQIQGSLEKRDTQHCTLLKIIRTSEKSHVDEQGVFFCNDYDDFDECVFMTSAMFKEIWGRTWSSMNQEERILPIVEISYKGQSIFRRYRQSSAIGLHLYQLGLTQRSIGLLCSDEDLVNKDVIEVKVGNKDCFFKNHPNHATRIAYEMSVEGNKLNYEANRISRQSRWISCVSLGIGILSIIISFILR